MIDVFLGLAFLAGSSSAYKEYKQTGFCDPFFEAECKRLDRVKHNYQPYEVESPAVTSQFMRR